MQRLVRYADSLAGKLVLTVGALMLAGSIMFAYFFYRYASNITIDNLTSHAHFTEDLVIRGLRFEMLNGSKQNLQETVAQIGKAPEIRTLLIVNRQGAVAFSAASALMGQALSDDPFIQSALEGKAMTPHISTGQDKQKLLTLYTPIFNEPSCSTSACHFHSPDNKVLGVLLTSMNASGIERASRQIMLGTLGVGAVFVSIISAALFVILYHFVSKPVARIEQGMQRLAQGNLDKPIEVGVLDEMGMLAVSFNNMAFEIKRSRIRMERWTQELQEEVDKKTTEIRQAQEQLIDAEKLASLGRLAAGVAHELNSPLTGVLTFAHLIKDRTPVERKEDLDDLDVIIEQTLRCSKIIKGLLGFSRKGSAERMPVNINDIVTNSVHLVKNQANFHNITIDVALDPKLPQTVVDPNQVQQMVLNIVSNAADAVGQGGRIAIATRTAMHDGALFIEVEFIDNGSGILPDHIGRIFEPFFTTKPVGKGTGLGLPVSYGIVKRHGGDITVKSKLGEGTTFIVKLPVVTAGEAQGQASKILGEK